MKSGISRIYIEVNTSISHHSEVNCATLIMTTPFQKFFLFVNLPTELQIQIWECSCQTVRSVPRVIRVSYDPRTNSFLYTFVIPPLLKTCRLSREVAQSYYSSLVPDSPYPVYFNPDIDIIYSKSRLDPLYLIEPEHHPDRPVLPLMDPSIDMSLIRFLVLDCRYWSYRLSKDINCPIKELRSFKNMTETFFLLPSLEESIERSRILQSNFPHLNPRDHPRSDLKARYERDAPIYNACPPSWVPGFRTYSDNSSASRQYDVRSCLNQHPWPPHFGPFDQHFYVNEFHTKKRMPRVSELIH